MAHLKKIQTTRDLQMKKRKMDEEKLKFKLRKLRQQIQQKQTFENKQNISKLRESMSLQIYRRRKLNSLPKVPLKEISEMNPMSPQL